MAQVSRLANVTIRRISGKDAFEIDQTGLWNLLSAALLNTDFDSDFYVSQNEDVRAGIKSGEIASAFEHYVQFGFLEGRRGWLIKVDERFYLSKYEDVKRSIDQGQFKNGQRHFDSIGESEGRLPYTGFYFFKTGEPNGRNGFQVFGKSRRA